MTFSPSFSLSLDSSNNICTSYTEITAFGENSTTFPHDRESHLKEASSYDRGPDLLDSAVMQDACPDRFLHIWQAFISGVLK